MAHLDTKCRTCGKRYREHYAAYPHDCPQTRYSCFNDPVMEDLYRFIFEEGGAQSTDAYGLLREALAYLQARIDSRPGSGEVGGLYGENIMDLLAWVNEAAATRGMLR